MKYLRYTCHGNLYADAECKKGNELVNDLIPYRPEFLSVCPDQYEQHTVHDENEYIPLSDFGKMQWHFKGEEA